MTPEQAMALVPIFVLAGLAVLLVLLAAFWRSHRLVFVLTQTGFGGALATIFIAYRWAPQNASTLLLIDAYALFFTGLIIAAAFVVALFAFPYLHGRQERPEEFYILLVLATLGSTVLVSSAHFGSLFLGLELLSVSLWTFAEKFDRKTHGTLTKVANQAA